MADGGDIALLIEPVARQLLGDPNARLSTAAELRYGKFGSLSIDLEHGRWYDHERQEGGGVLDLIARETGCNPNGAAHDWLRDHGFAEPEREQKGRIVATYDYVDEDGTLLFQVVRMEPKTFRQRKPDGAGGWVWSTKGVRQVPYRLPELSEAIAMGRTVYVVEGEKDADTLARLGLAATSNARGAGKWPADLNEHFAGADVVILPDNDDVGRDHSATVARALAGKAERVRILELPDLHPKGDVSDWLAAGGTLERLHALVESGAVAPDVTRPHLHSGAVWFAEAEGRLVRPEWLVDDLLTRGDLSLVYGPSQSGKSFFATHLALAIARGIDIFDKRVRRGGVIYLAAEGKKGFVNRLKAYRMENGIDEGSDLPFLLIPSAIDLFSQEGDIDVLLGDLLVVEEEMQRRFGVATELMVIDTYAAVTPGSNENASEDVSRVMVNLERIKEAIPHANLMIVHHTSAAGERPRGHTSLFAAADNVIKVVFDEAKNRTAKITKMKDGEDNISIGFRLDPVTIGSRDDGKPITSCVVVPAQVDGTRTGRGPRRSLTPQAKIALSSLREAILDLGEPAPSALHLPFGVNVVKYATWHDRFAKVSFAGDDGNPETIRKALQRAGEQLLAAHIIGRSTPYVWIAREPEGQP